MLEPEVPPPPPPFDLAKWKQQDYAAVEAREANLAYLAALAAAAAAAARETRDRLFERRELRLEAEEMEAHSGAWAEAHEQPPAALPLPPDDQERTAVAAPPRDLSQVAERRDEPASALSASAPWWQRAGAWIADNLGRGLKITRGADDALALRHFRFNRLSTGKISVSANTPPGTRLAYRHLVEERGFDFAGTRYNPETVSARTAGGLLRRAVSRSSFVTAGVFSVAQNLWSFGTNPEQGATFSDRTLTNREFWVSTVVDFAVSLAVGVAAAAFVGAGIAAAAALGATAPLWLAVVLTAAVGTGIGLLVEALGIPDIARGWLNGLFAGS